MGTLKTFIAAATLLAAASPMAAQSANVTGTWTASFVTPDRTYPARIELKQDHDTVTGTVGAGSGTEGNKLTGSIKGNDLTFAFSTVDPNGGGRTLAIEVKASISSDGLSGSFNVDAEPTGTFSAKRDESKGSKDTTAPKDSKDSKDPKGAANVEGTWAFTVDLGSITASPTVLFKQDGEALTGTYTSQQYGAFPLKGTVKGNQVQFGFTMSVEGNAIDVVFAGTADGDSLKGTVNYGGIGEGNFTGKKK